MLKDSDFVVLTTFLNNIELPEEIIDIKKKIDLFVEKIKLQNTYTEKFQELDKRMREVENDGR